MSNSYRELAIVEKYEETKPRGLVRTGGCACKPPGTLWVWWKGVARGDLWYCDHGSCYVWCRAVTSDPGYHDRWKSYKGME